VIIVSNAYEGKYAAPKRHPITCANPAPWLITEMELEIDKVWIRNQESIWFRADQCFVGTYEDVRQFVEWKGQQPTPSETPVETT
jgi:hypothetical protein